MAVQLDSWVEEIGGQVLIKNINIGIPLAKISNSNTKSPNILAAFLEIETSWV